jgi:hypothetical protein
MRVQVLRALDDYELTVRHTDEVGEAEGMSDAEIYGMEEELKRFGRYWLDADRYCKPVRS